MPATRLAKRPSKRPRSAVALSILFGQREPMVEDTDRAEVGDSEGCRAGLGEAWMTAGIQMPPFSRTA